MDINVSFDSTNFMRGLERQVDRIASEHLDGLEQRVRAFHARQTGRPVGDIQRDYKQEFGNDLSAEDAQLYSEGAPLTVNKTITR